MTGNFLLLLPPAAGVILGIWLMIRYIALGQRNHRLIDRHMTALGNTLLSCHLSVFLSGRSPYRIYNIRYQDPTGRIHRAIAQTGPHHHVLIREEEVIQPGSGPPPPLPVHEQIRLLESENEALRNKIAMLGIDPSHSETGTALPRTPN